ncbi:cbb3-type cytochrome c oxidase subunit III [Methylacidiphilum kamchatkense Kam1]|uniref:Cbb3-type cytochrome c oxidase subunit III n=1 Tax=Methylacidiphilum kamchatkense Kam1 TaxID=1202785 RepID=A0A516TJG6_9BACT|nr:cbb3-type cytochrome c oxidase subunit III [Methylacidiphilum kamchatkense Kam1]
MLLRIVYWSKNSLSFLLVILLCTLADLSAHSENGKALYREHCSSCHGLNGEGLGSNPPLKNSSWVTGDPQRLIRLVLNGYSGRIEVDGEIYRGNMPAWRTVLNDKEIASILSYLRSNWGGGPITPQEVATVRGKTKNEPTTGAISGCRGNRMGAMHSRSMGRGMRGGMGCGGCGQ